MRVLSMTPEQINTLPPTERTTYIQIVSCSIHIPFDILSDVFFSGCREPLLVFRQDEGVRSFFIFFGAT